MNSTRKNRKSAYENEIEYKARRINDGLERMFSQFYDGLEVLELRINQIEYPILKQRLYDQLVIIEKDYFIFRNKYSHCFSKINYDYEKTEKAKMINTLKTKADNLVETHKKELRAILAEAEEISTELSCDILNKKFIPLLSKISEIQKKENRNEN